MSSIIIYYGTSSVYKYFFKLIDCENMKANLLKNKLI